MAKLKSISEFSDGRLITSFLNFFFPSATQFEFMLNYWFVLEATNDRKEILQIAGLKLRGNHS